MKKQQAKQLISRYNQGNATPQERLLVEQWFLTDLKNSIYAASEDDTEIASEKIRQNLVNHIALQKSPPKVVTLWPRIAAAASILLILGIGGYFLLKQKAAQQVIAIKLMHDIAPGGNKAVLTLANGRQIVLTGALNGVVALQGSVRVDKTADGQLVYDKNQSAGNTAVAYNTLSTPRGGQYWVTLPDSTRVLLNAASSLKYPTAFTGNERRVELSGEAYFEVAHNKHLPFRVSSNGQTVEVLGTHFDINAYNDEPDMKTTLLEGSVKVSENGQTIVLKPGQQSVISGNSAITVKDADIEQATAWKNGEFNFNETDVQGVMRQVSRWYDVDIEYPGKIPGYRLSGTFSRNMPASKALKLLEFTGINFKIEGRKIIVK